MSKTNRNTIADRKHSGVSSLVSRRRFLALGVPVVATPAILRYSRAYAQEPVVKIGVISPRTGFLAREGDNFVIESARRILSEGVENNGRRTKIELIVSSGDSVNSRELASELIYGEQVDMILTASSPDTVVPVADLAEVAGVPCISTNPPWEPFFFGRGGDPAFGFEWTYHFSLGFNDLVAAFVALWRNSGVEPIVGGMFPAGDFSPGTGIAGKLKGQGFTYVDPGPYRSERFALASIGDLTPQIDALKASGCEIVTGFMLPPAFKSFWQQAFEREFKPKIVTFLAALLYPKNVEEIGDRAVGLSSEVWWSPHFPFKSSLTGQSAAAFAKAYSKASGRPWPQSIGPQHALFEVAADVIKRTVDISDRAAIIDAVASTDLQTIAGPVSWTGKPVKNVSLTPVVTGQWRNGPDGFELVIVDATTYPDISTESPLQLLS